MFSQDLSDEWSRYLINARVARKVAAKALDLRSSGKIWGKIGKVEGSATWRGKLEQNEKKRKRKGTQQILNCREVKGVKRCLKVKMCKQGREMCRMWVGAMQVILNSRGGRGVKMLTPIQKRIDFPAKIYFQFASLDEPINSSHFGADRKFPGWAIFSSYSVDGRILGVELVWLGRRLVILV